MENLVEMRNITKSFPGVLALDKVNLQLNSGEVLALLGEKGAGKSTLIKILSRVHTSFEGEISSLMGRKLKIGTHVKRRITVLTLFIKN